MKLSKILKNGFLIVFACLALSACATSKKSTGQMQGDVYTGTDTVEYLASGVHDRVFFATNESVLTTASREKFSVNNLSPLPSVLITPI